MKTPIRPKRANLSFKGGSEGPVRYTCRTSCFYTTLLVLSFVPLVLNYVVHFHADADVLFLHTTHDKRKLSEVRAGVSESWMVPPKMCPHTSGLYERNATAFEALQNSIEQAVAFHTRGGSLKSVQRFLDRQIHPTLERLDITFQERQRKSKSSATTPNQKVDEYLKDYFQRHNVRRGGYGQPLPIAFKQKHSPSTTFSGDNLVDSVLHGAKREGKRWIDVMEDATPERFQAAVGPIGPSCPNMMHFSENEGMEEKSFCVSDKAESYHDECHIFSIGSNDQWGFETNVRKDLSYCHTHTFDCTLKGPPENQPNDEMVPFYPFCVSGDSKQETVAAGASRREYLP